MTSGSGIVVSPLLGIVGSSTQCLTERRVSQLADGTVEEGDVEVEVDFLIRSHDSADGRVFGPGVEKRRCPTLLMTWHGDAVVDRSSDLRAGVAALVVALGSRTDGRGGISE